MKDSKNMTIEELVEELSCQMVASDYRPSVKQEILSQFAEKDKVIELMAKEIQEYTSYAPIKVIIQDFAGRVKQQLQADKGKADE